MSLFRSDTIRSGRLTPALGAALLAVAAAVPAASAQAPALTTNKTVASAGDFQLSWQGGGEGAVYQLQQAGPQGFATPAVEYRGPDTATQLSGLPDGEYRFRIRQVEPSTSAWSEPVSVQVSHHPLSRALGFFAVGLVVFLATVLLIVRGSRAD